MNSKGSQFAAGFSHSLPHFMDYISGEIFVSIPPSNLGFRWNEY